MEHIAIGTKLQEILKKYRYALLVLVLGVGLMLLPVGKSETTAAEPVSTQPEQDTTDMERRLEAILSQIQGAGEVQVLLSVAQGEQTVYQADTADGRTDTVIITDGDRAQQGLVEQVNPPRYLGAVIVCQGADSAAVRLAIVEAVASATGLGTDHISVLKMK